MPVLLLVVFINFVGIGALIPVLPYTVIETLGPVGNGDDAAAGVIRLCDVFIKPASWSFIRLYWQASRANCQPRGQCVGAYLVCLFQ